MGLSAADPGPDPGPDPEALKVGLSGIDPGAPVSWP
jgi:hypothetical protein